MKFFTRSWFFRNKVHPLLSRIPLYDYWLLRRKSYLRDQGWFRSFKTGKSINADGDPLPWITYAAIDFLKERLPADCVVFEYGAGYGTNWWAKHAKSVISVEHNEKWLSALSDDIPENCQMIFRNLGEGYEEAVSEFDQKFDLIVIDGRNRVKCVYTSVDFLTDRGIIVFDDSNREKYREGIDFLLSAGFRQLRFTGFSPIEFLKCETSLFYKPGNLVGL